MPWVQSTHSKCEQTGHLRIDRVFWESDSCPFNFVVSEEHHTNIEDEEIAVHTVNCFNKIQILINLCE